MKAWKTLVLAACVLGIVEPLFATGVFTNTFPCTKDTFIGRGLYGTDSNYGTTRFGQVGNAAMDGCLMDFDRAAMLAWVNTTVQAQPNGAAIILSDLNQIADGGLTMTLNVTAYAGAWQETSSPPPTMFGHYYWPAVRLSQGQNWQELTATFNNADGAGNPWRSATGTVLTNIYTNSYQWMNNTIANAASEPWGASDINGGVDVYSEDIPRPWVLDDAVAFAALKNPDVIGFQLLHDYQNKPWASANSGEDVCNGQVYSREHGSVEFRPFVDITIDVPKIIAQTSSGHNPWLFDPNGDGKVDFRDYLILERNFGKSGKTWRDGDFTGDGWVKFADYLLLEQSFGKKEPWSVPEPASIGLLVLGGLAMLKRRGA